MVDEQQNVDPVCFPMMRKFLVNWAAYMWVAGERASYNVNVVMLMVIMSRWSVQEITEAVCLLEVRAQLSPFLTTTTLMLNFR